MISGGQDQKVEEGMNGVGGVEAQDTFMVVTVR
jgi:hypothetical protein